MRFADRAQEYLLHNGLLTPAAATARFRARMDQINLAVIAESARWGDAKVASPLTKDNWLTSVNYELNYFFPNRSQILLSQLKLTTLPSWRGGGSAPLYPSLAPPEFNQHGGQVDPGYLLYLTYPAGTVYYTLDGTDPRLPGGAVNPSPSVKTYVPGVPIMLTSSTLVRARAKSGNNWSALNEAQFYVGEPAAAGKLAITELNYNPYDPTAAEKAVNPNFDHDSFEFIELYNTTNAILDLTGAHFSNGITFNFAGSSAAELAPHQYVVIVVDRSAFEARYGTGVTIAGVYTGNLANNGEQITLLDRFNQPILDFKYNDAGKWPGRADGRGSTLVVLNTGGDYDDSDNWCPSALYGGNPGLGGAGPAADVVVNEILSWPVAPDVAAIELYNTSDQTINVGGWYLSDTSGNYEKFRIPDGTTIAAHGYRVYNEHDFNPSHGGDPTDIVLSGTSGNDVWLLQADAAGNLKRFADHAEIGAALAGVSFGRSPNGSGEFALMSTVTLGDANSAPRAGAIVINEIHSNPDVKTESVEYVELYNNGSQTVNLSGWYFSDGISYTFPVGTTLAAGGYLVVAQNPTAVKNKFQLPALPLGPYTGSLDNTGEKLVLRDASGIRQDEVQYGYGFPWPTVGDSPGYSLELVNPSLDNDLGGSWRRSNPEGAGVQPATLLAAGSQWRYLPGTSQPSSTWHDRVFNDTGWTLATLPIGYGESLVRTTLAMRNSYSTLYLRNTFTVANPAQIANLQIRAQYDDGFTVWINGTQVLTVNAPSSDPPYNALAVTPAGSQLFETFTLAYPVNYLLAGSNTIAVQLLNCNRNSLEAFFDAQLVAWPSLVHPTPGAGNAAYAANAPPQMRQVEHTPQEPAAGLPVAITVKVTDPDGVQGVSLKYQLVDPGSYIAYEDAAYQTQWTTVSMYDNGTNGDQFSGDGIYTAVMPAQLQTNRRLVRYRITASDMLNASVTAPYPDDPQQNFAYFVYSGVPAWSGAIQPGGADPSKNQVITYPASVMGSLPVYQLLSKKDSVEQSTWTQQYQGDLNKWSGTLVYDGVVYDNIHYRTRGGVWRYSMGKNMWKIDLNRGHDFQARDNYGNKYLTAWRSLNLGACIQQGDYWHRGEQGLFEAVGSALFNLAGEAAFKTNFAELRIIDEAGETGATQYSGDLWGLYLAIEQDDGRFLDEHGLPDGNLYKMDSSDPDVGPGGGMKANQGPTQNTDNSDLLAFTTAYNGTTSDLWWRENLDLESYYSYRSIVEAIHHYDIGYGKNYFYYHDPVTNKWSVHPWDLDLTWADNMYGNGEDPFKSRVLSRTAFALEYHNRMREIRDLLYNSEQTGMLIDETARFIYNSAPGATSMVDADRAMWDYNPIMVSGYVNPSKAGQGRFYAGNPPSIIIPAPGGFPGMIQKMKNYVASRGTWIDSSILTDDYLVPYKPTVTYIGAAGYPIDGLRFRSSSYSGPYSTPFGAMEWRIARITNPGAADFDPTQPRYYEINPQWESGELTTFNDTIAIPGSGLEVGERYRVRVRMRDDAGRWSHWSNAAEFVASGAIAPLTDALRISEVMYNPVPPPLGSPFVANDFQYIELTNTGTQALGLAGVQFTQGVTYTFPTVSLDPGQQIVVVASQAAFQSRYGTGINVAAGAFTGRLSITGGRIQLKGLNQTILDFTYSNADPWPTRPNGKGSSLEVLDTAGDYNSAANWRASNEYNGSPGHPGTGPIVDVVVNEVLTHTDKPLVDAIELYNTTDNPITIGGWYLSDSSDNYQKFVIPAGTVLQPHGQQGAYKAYYQGHWVGDTMQFAADEFGGLGANGFGLNSYLGDDVWLVAADTSGNPTRFVDHVEFGAAANGESFGRWSADPQNLWKGDLYPLIDRTLGDPNDKDGNGPRVGPIVISELMYCPGNMPNADDLEYVEIYNPTSTAISSLAHWRLRGGISFDFPADKGLAPHQVIVVVPFDPSDQNKLALFRSMYAIGSSVTIVGGYTGHLRNSGDDVQLQRPDDPPLEEPNLYPGLLEDEVVYSGAWGAFGTGQALQRLDTGLWGNDPLSWTTAVPSPGQSVVGRRIFYNKSAFDGNTAGADPLDDNAVATDKQALLPGQTATFANYTSYSRGINGIMVDIAGLLDIGELIADDFEFRVGNNNLPGSWPLLVTAPTSITTRSIADGITRVTVIWDDSVIQNQWLQVTIKATSNTALVGPDTFYFGNAIAETGNNPANAVVDLQDDLGARTHKTAFAPAPITSPYDFNRDRRVNATDELIARFNHSLPPPLQLIDLTAFASGAPAPAIVAALQEPQVAPAGAVGLSGSVAVSTVLLPLPGILGPAQHPAVHDAVLASGQKSRGLEPWSSVWAWLAEFELTPSKKPAARKDIGSKAAVDTVLAAY